MAEYIGLEDETFGGLEDFCDAILKTEDGCSFKVHQVILAKNSIYFRSLFLFRGRDRSNAEFSLPWFSGRIVKQLLQYLYNGKILLEENNIMELLLASDYFLLDDLLLKCQKFVKEQLSVANCVKIFIASHINGRLNLYKYSRRFIRVNFISVLEQPTNEIADIPFELFKALLEDDNLNIPDETYVWRAVEKWIENCTERMPAAYELLSTIRFRNSNSGLVQSLIKSHFLRNNLYLKGLKDIMSIAEPTDLSFVFKSALSSICPKIDSTRLRQPKKLYLIATRHDSCLIDIYVTYNEDVWISRKITSIPKYDFFWVPRYMIVVEHLAYVFDSKLTGRAMVFNLLDKSWEEIQPMNHAREGYIIFHVGQFIYAVGGNLDAAIERYDYRMNSRVWKDLGPTVNVVKAALTENKIYILGKCSSSNIMTVKEYDTIRGKFSEMPAPEIAPTEFAVTVNANQLFVIAGSGCYAKSVEVFSPDSRVWKKFQSLPNVYGHPKAKVIESKLIVYSSLISGPPPVFWKENGKSWETFGSKSFFPRKKYLIQPIKDFEVITCLMNENLSWKNKWELFEDETL